jgi:hypothetical protein
LPCNLVACLAAFFADFLVEDWEVERCHHLGIVLL